MKAGFILFILLSFFVFSGCLSENFYANTPEGYCSLADIYAEKGEVEKAIAALKNGIHVFENDGEKAACIMYCLGEIYRDYSKDYELSMRTFEKISLEYTESEKAPYGLYEAAQIAEYKLKDYSKAKQDYKKIIDCYPTSPIRDKAFKNYIRLIQMGY